MWEGKLDSLKGINGYKAAAVADYTGEILMHDSGTLKADLAFSAATMNDIFRSAHKASKDLNLGITSTMAINTKDTVVLMVCSGEDSRAHIHLFVILDREGNQALAKMTMEKLIPQIVNELSA